MAEIRKGDLVEVVDASPLKGKRKLPFAMGAQFIVARVAEAGVQLAGVGGFWRRERFGVVRRG